MLIDKQGNVLVEMENKVIPDADPTAHVERQIVDWYFEELKQGADLPSPSELTILSSLDPCMMCTGSILSAHFNVVSMGHDARGGVDYDNRGTFNALPASLAAEAKKTFGYLGAKDGSFHPSGPIPAVLAPSVLGSDLIERSHQSWEDGANAVHANETPSPHPSQITNPTIYFSQPKNAALLEQIRERHPHFLASKAGSAQSLPPALGDILLNEARSAEARGARMNAAALVDPFGNILMVSGGNEHISPIKTAVIHLVRDYAKLRDDLGDEGRQFLTDLSHCRVVALKGIGFEASDIATVSAFCTASERKETGDFNYLHYIVPSQSQADMDALIERFPPLYKTKGRVIAQVTDEETDQPNDAGSSPRQPCLSKGFQPLAAPHPLNIMYNYRILLPIQNNPV